MLPLLATPYIFADALSSTGLEPYEEAASGVAQRTASLM
jgi:hypothetical protein